MAKTPPPEAMSTESVDLFLQQVGLKLRDARVQIGMSLPNAARFAGLNPGYLYTVEQGTANPTLKVLHKLTEGIGILPRDIMPDGSTESTLTDAGAASLVAALQRVASVMASVMKDRESGEAAIFKQLSTILRFLPDLEAFVASQAVASEPAADDPPAAKAKPRGSKPLAAKPTDTGTPKLTGRSRN